MDEDSSRRAARSTGAPRWVKVIGIVALVVAVVLLVLLLSGHRPGRHLGAAVSTGQAHRAASWA